MSDPYEHARQQIGEPQPQPETDVVVEAYSEDNWSLKSRARIYHTRKLLDEEVSAIREIEGVDNAQRLYRYSIVVGIGYLFTWEEVEPRVLAILKGGVSGE